MILWCSVLPRIFRIRGLQNEGGGEGGGGDEKLELHIGEKRKIEIVVEQKRKREERNKVASKI